MTNLPNQNQYLSDSPSTAYTTYKFCYPDRDVPLLVQCLHETACAKNNVSKESILVNELFPIVENRLACEDEYIDELYLSYLNDDNMLRSDISKHCNS